LYRDVTPPEPPQFSAVLPRSFYDRDTVLVAHDLLGKMLVHRVNGCARIGRIVEVEAYLGPQDLAAHSSKGRTPRTEVMFGPPGYAYVYLIYGMHHCMNVVTDAADTGSAVLLRALEPMANLPVPANGPGRLCKAMEINKTHYGHDLCSNDLFIAAPVADLPFTTVTRPRVGVDYAGEWAARPLRFYIEGNPHVSKK
jgi:DNA-3-methyladenine glycosylase